MKARQLIDEDPKTDAFNAIEQEKEDLIDRLVQQAMQAGSLRSEDHGRGVRRFSHWLRTRTVAELYQLFRNLGETPG